LRPPTLGLDQADGVAVVAVLGQVGDRHVGALLGEGGGDGASDPRAGDEGPAALELPDPR
jgi:hypothetical protein